MPSKLSVPDAPVKAQKHNQMNEKNRLHHLRKLQLHKVRRPEVFDTISCLAAKALGCPTALVTVVDEETQWFLGRTGFEMSETPRSLSFCSVCMASEAPLLVTDASQDPRFANNLLVTEPPFIRSYLGIPLRADSGILIGTLCTISPAPNAFLAKDINTLQAIAVLAEEALIAHDHGAKLCVANISILELEQALQQAESAVKVGTWRLDLALNSLQFSDGVFDLFELPKAPQVSVTAAIEYCEPRDRPFVRKALAEAQNLGRPIQLELDISHSDGTKRCVRVLGKRVGTRDTPNRLVGILADITQEHVAERALKHALEHDPLTGLLNRSAFNEHLTAATKACDGSVQTVTLIDLERFRDANEEVGHIAADQLLVELAARIVRKAGEDTMVARWGGDEFALLFPANTLLDGVISTSMTLLDEIAKDLVVRDGVVNLSATCGIAQFEGPCSGEDLIRRAELALSFAKEQGGGCLHSWSEDMDGASKQRQRAAAIVKHALREERIFAAYQPIIEIETGKVAGVEALLRIDNGETNPLTAADVFSAITDAKISRKVSRYMLEQVLRDGSELLNKIGPTAQIGINVSEADLRFREDGEDFVNMITRLMRGSALRPNNITLEVTETMLLRDETGSIRDGLRALDRLGYQIALDDFGTGFSSLTHLRYFPIRKVKIDKEFVAGIAWDHQARLIIQAIVQMSRSLGLDVVAEGVENATEEMFLRAIGCRYAQGYRYGKAARLVSPPPASLKQVAG